MSYETARWATGEPLRLCTTPDGAALLENQAHNAKVQAWAH